MEGLVGVPSLLLEIHAVLPQTGRSTPTGNQVRNQRHVTRDRNAGIKQCMARTGINTSTYMRGDYDNA